MLSVTTICFDLCFGLCFPWWGLTVVIADENNNWSWKLKELIQTRRVNIIQTTSRMLMLTSDKVLSRLQSVTILFRRGKLPANLVARLKEHTSYL